MLGFLVENQICTTLKYDNGKYDKNDYQAGLKARQRYLIRRSFKRGKQKGSLEVNPIHMSKRNDYVRTILDNRCKPIQERRIEVYNDES